MFHDKECAPKGKLSWTNVDNQKMLFDMVHAGFALMQKTCIYYNNVSACVLDA